MATVRVANEQSRRTTRQSLSPSSRLAVISRNGIYEKFLMRFHPKLHNVPSPPASERWCSRRARKKCFMINTAEISMFNLNPLSGWVGGRARASDELAIMKIVYINFCMRQQYERKKKIFIKIFHPLFCCDFFRRQLQRTKNFHPFSLVKKFSYFASLKKWWSGRSQAMARAFGCAWRCRRSNCFWPVVVVGFILLYWFKFIFLLVAVFSIIFMYFFIAFSCRSFFTSTVKYF